MSQKPAVVFDFDGTLADSCQDVGSALNRSLADQGLPTATAEQVRQWIGSGAATLIARALAEMGESESRIQPVLERFRIHYAACCLDETRLYDGIRQCLSDLKDLSLAVVSNKPERFLRVQVPGLGMADDFCMVLGPETLGKAKPDPAVLAYVASQFNVQPADLWMVGDSEIDVEAARVVGAHSIGCAWGLRGFDALRTAGADHVVGHPREIPPLIRSYPSVQATSNGSTP